MADDQRLDRVTIDPASLAAASPEQEHERKVAVIDLLEQNSFRPQGAADGPFGLDIALAEGRLRLDVKGPAFERRHLLSLQPFRGVIRDYFMICDSYHDAVRGGRTTQIEALDMGRRGVHNEGAEILRQRLADKITLDVDTSRRLFTLICALHWRGQL